MKKSTEDKLREAFKDGFDAARHTGVLQGAVAIAKVVLDKANDTNKTTDERLDDIVKFCEVSLRNKD